MREGVEARAMRIDGKRTTLCLEPQVWAGIDAVAQRNGDSWATWVSYALEYKPDIMSRTAWVRVALVNELMGKLAAAEAGFTEDMV